MVYRYISFTMDRRKMKRESLIVLVILGIASLASAGLVLTVDGDMEKRFSHIYRIKEE